MNQQREKFMAARRLHVVSACLRSTLALTAIALAPPILAATVTTDIVYQDHIGNWVLGQTASQTDVSTGLVQTQTIYDATTALPTKTYAFGRLVSELTYNADGTIAIQTDGAGNVTSFTSWYRGRPRNVGFADGTSIGTTVNDFGQLLSVTDETSAQTTYEYDAGGRLSKVTYPQGDSVAWNTWNGSFRPLTSADWRPAGIADGQWMRQESRGNYRKITYFDAAWRPININEYDESNKANTVRSQVFSYDTMGRQVFVSYPARDTDGTNQGTWTEYDALGRVTSTSQDSELGMLTTLVRYDGTNGYNVIVRNPRGAEVRTWYQTFDAPSGLLPITISAPEGQTTEIARDVFGKPRSIQRRNGDGTLSLSRAYVYDTHQRLCKSVEPELGASAYGYDGADNLIWQASGLAQIGATSCDESAAYVSGRRVDRTYDKRNRLKTLSFPDSNGNQAWSYHPDGRPSQVITSNNESTTQTVNTYTYNKRRLLVAETTGQVGWYTWSLGYGYDGNGALASVVYPSGQSVDYQPNALGQPTRAGAYATSVQYYPNGAMSSFLYGNNLSHIMLQNARQLPSSTRDGFAEDALSTGYTYDANGNVLGIDDRLNNARDRTMQYDALDRLTQATSSSFGGDGILNYTYDVLDNLRTAKLGGSKDYNYLYDTSNRLSSVRTSAGATIIGLSYDAQGNLNNKNGQTYAFDYGNRLRAATGKQSYRYDAQGRRVVSTTPDGYSILSMYGNDGVLRYTDDQRMATMREYITLNGSVVAERITRLTPAAPVLTVPSFSNNGNYTVTWTAVDGATSYELQRQTAGGAWTQVYAGAGLSWSVTGATEGQYGYRVRSCRVMLCGDWSTATISVLLPPSLRPELTVTRPVYGNYIVSWTTVTGGSTYRLEERINGTQGGAWALLQDSTLTTRSFSNRPAGAYEYRVTACNLAGCGPASQLGFASPIYPPASAPTLSAPTLALGGNYTVTWTDVTGATQYILEESANGGTWYAFAIDYWPRRTLSAKPTGSYAYRVRAGNEAGWSGYSAAVTVSSLQPPAPPTLSAPATSSGSFSLSWSAVATAVEYRLEQRVNGGAWATAQSDGSTVSNRSGLGSGSYDYRVAACNAAGCGSYSNIATTVVDAPPATPTGLTAKFQVLDASNSIRWKIRYTATWAHVAGATRYEATGRGLAYNGVWNTWTLDYVGSPSTASFQVRACTATQCSPWSAPVTATP